MYSHVTITLTSVCFINPVLCREEKWDRVVFCFSLKAIGCQTKKEKYGNAVIFLFASPVGLYFIGTDEIHTTLLHWRVFVSERLPKWMHRSCALLWVWVDSLSLHPLAPTQTPTPFSALFRWFTIIFISLSYRSIKFQM
jgi:hypothetical protein